MKKKKNIFFHFLCIAFVTVLCGSAFISHASAANLTISDKDMIISAPYHIAYDKNTTAAVTEMPDETPSFWRERVVVAEQIPERRGHTFMRWDTKKAGDGKQYKPGEATSIAEDLQLYAQWKVNEYNITYKLDGGKNHPDNPDKYTYGEGVPSFKDPTKPGNEFKGWYTDPDFKNPITSIGKDDIDDITLYAKWDPLILVVYDGNEATSGEMRTELVSKEKAKDGYEVKANDNFTSFARKGFSFAGWDSVNYASAKDLDYKASNLPQKIKFEELMSIHESQAKEKSASFFRKARASTGVASDTPVATLYAGWDKAPEIGPEDPNKEDFIEFYEGQKVSKVDLLENLIANDTEDGNLTSKIKITKIAYSEGRLVGGKPQPGYTVTFEKDLTEEEEQDMLDTWFMELEKDKTVTHVVSYEVTDSAGNIGTYERKVKVKYNNFPEIEAEDQYYTLEEANDGLITIEELLLEGKATDVEDKEAIESKLTFADILDKEGNSNQSLIDAKEAEFESFTGSGYVILNYYVKDAYGKEAYHPITVYVSEDGVIVEAPKSEEVRFINKKNYDKNAGLYDETLSKEELDALREEHSGTGGLYVDSKWYIEEELKTMLLDSFAKTESSDPWIFSPETMKSIRKDVKEHGIGKEQNLEFWEKYLK